jgi:hypothetical protein
MRQDRPPASGAWSVPCLLPASKRRPQSVGSRFAYRLI